MNTAFCQLHCNASQLFSSGNLPPGIKFHAEQVFKSYLESGIPPRKPVSEHIITNDRFLSVYPVDKVHGYVRNLFKKT